MAAINPLTGKPYKNPGERARVNAQLAQQAADQGNAAAARAYAANAISAAQNSRQAAAQTAAMNAAWAAQNATYRPTPSNPTPGGDTDTDTDTDTGGGGTPPRTLVSIETVYERGFNVTYNVFSDGSREERSRERERTAGDAVEEMFRNLGLGDAFASSLKGIIDGFYQSNVKPTDAEILAAVYSSEPYKQRFKANEVIRERIKNGQGRPGDRMLTPAEYIEAENTYRTILADRDMPTGFYDSPDDFTNLIANSISASEFKSRVDTAYDALNFADAEVIGALRDYYNMSPSDMAAYLLDPARAMPILEGRAAQATGAYGLNSRTELQRMYGTATIAGIGRRQGLMPGQEMSGEIYDLGKTKQETEAAFSKAAEDAPAVERLGKLYGEAMDFKDIVREDLNLSGGAASGRKRRKFASKERAQFSKQSALGKSSLRDRTDV
jgi:hypothetical protein